MHCFSFIAVFACFSPMCVCVQCSFYFCFFVFFHLIFPSSCVCVCFPTFFKSFLLCVFLFLFYVFFTILSWPPAWVAVHIVSEYTPSFFLFLSHFFCYPLNTPYRNEFNMCEPVYIEWILNSCVRLYVWACVCFLLRTTNTRERKKTPAI